MRIPFGAVNRLKSVVASKINVGQQGTSNPRKRMGLQWHSLSSFVNCAQPFTNVPNREPFFIPQNHHDDGGKTYAAKSLPVQGPGLYRFWANSLPAAAAGIYRSTVSPRREPSLWPPAIMNGWRRKRERIRHRGR